MRERGRRIASREGGVSAAKPDTPRRMARSPSMPWRSSTPRPPPSIPQPQKLLVAVACMAVSCSTTASASSATRGRQKKARGRHRLPEPPSQERSACSPGRPGDAHRRPLALRHRGPANPRAALAARRGIFVRRRFPTKGRTVRAAGSHRRVARLLTVVASAHCVPARHGDTLSCPQRPPTSCAHRLRKPDRTCELLALSVARWARGRGLQPAPPSTASDLRRLPRGTPHAGHLPPRQARRCRRRFRTTATGRTRAPSVGSTRTLRSERAR